MKRNSILISIITLVYFNLIAQDNVRSIKTYPAPLLSIDGQYGIWHKTGFKVVADTSRITRPFIICEGFDVANDIEFIDLYEQLNDNAYILRDNKRNLSNIKTINNLL